jgi:cation diffusion facilitator CzcD-associated flavoprotein CzcO
MDKEIKDVFEVIIIGAGAAGIGAALKLKKENVPFVLL